MSKVGLSQQVSDMSYSSSSYSDSLSLATNQSHGSDMRLLITKLVIQALRVTSLSTSDFSNYRSQSNKLIYFISRTSENYSGEDIKFCNQSYVGEGLLGFWSSRSTS